MPAEPAPEPKPELHLVEPEARPLELSQAQIAGLARIIGPILEELAAEKRAQQQCGPTPPESHS